jgi:hypothetical protein
MKKVFNVMLALALILSIGTVASAQQATSVVALAISSCPVTGNTYDSTVWHPLTISTNVALGQICTITVTNRNPAVQQNVKFYEWGRIGTSSASVRLIWQESVGMTPYTVTTTSTTTFIGCEPTKTITFVERWLLQVKRGLAIQKSSPDSVVDVSVQYR